LKITPSRLSEILRRKQGLSTKSARKICQKLNLSPSETETFCNLVQASDARSKIERRRAQQKIERQKPPPESMQLLQEDTFKIISDWYHYAILELITTQAFRSDPAWIARQLGIPKTTVEGAIERLHRLELIDFTPRGEIESTGVQLTTTFGVPSESIRKFNRQTLEKALEAISLQTVEERDSASLTVAIHSDDFTELRMMIQDQRRALNQRINELNARRKPNTVYCLSTQFFRLIQKGVS
jgi:uncharacterized protein (TIGR02147 family)